MTMTHVAGPSITIDKRTIQRCLVCGEKLSDTVDLTGTGGLALNFLTVQATWEPGRLVHVTSFGCVTGGVFESADELPPDFCLNLVEM